MSFPDPSPQTPLEFDLSDTRPAERRPIATSAQSRGPTWLESAKARGGAVGALASAAIVALKFLSTIKLALIFLLKFKAFVTAGTMLLSMWLEARVFGWPLAVGIVMMIFIHECGHAVAARKLGHPYSGMIFVPFMGAAVFHRGGGSTVAQDAFVGIMGPIFGTLVGVLFYVAFVLTHLPVLLVLASWTFFINLFNLLPTPPLDGGWITPVFSPKLLALGMVLLLFVAFRNPFVILIAVLSLPRVIAGWKASPENSSYFTATPRDRWTYGLLYIGLAAILALAHTYTTGLLSGLPGAQVA